MSTLDGLPPTADALQMARTMGRLESDVARALADTVRVSDRLDHIDQTVVQMRAEIAERMATMSSQMAVLISRLDVAPSPPSIRIADLLRSPAAVAVAIGLVGVLIVVLGPATTLKLITGDL